MGIQKTFKALSDRNRRQILDLLKRRPMTAGEIGEHFPSPVDPEGCGADPGRPPGQVYLL